MIIHEGIGSLPLNIRNAVVTIGTFDGVHLGHQEILKRIIELSRKNDGETALVTFWPHPRFVLNPNESKLKLLSTFSEKAKSLEKIGLDHLIKIEFTKEFSQWSSERFIQEILLGSIQAKKLVIGYDHHFGKNREGGFDYLKEHADRYGFTVEEISRQDIDNVGISSTKIRNALLSGDVQEAEQFLGHPYSVSGTVVSGDQIGRELGFPTANISVDASYKLIPADGSYVVNASIGNEKYGGMLNIGSRPTVEGKEKRMEVNLFDFNQDIYDEPISINFIQRLRAEQKFESTDELMKQLAEDKLKALKILNV